MGKKKYYMLLAVINDEKGEPTYLSCGVYDTPKKALEAGNTESFAYCKIVPVYMNEFFMEEITWNNPEKAD